jgi:hypothetical protein
MDGRIQVRASLKRRPPLSDVLCESCLGTAPDTIDIELMPLSSDCSFI